MSSMALQSPAPLPTSPASHYAPLSPSSLTRQGYHASQPQQPYDRQQYQHQQHPQVAPSSTAHMSHTDSPMSSRATFSSPIVPSAAVNAVASIPDYHQPSPSASSERRRHAQAASVSAPYNYPPRSSSNRHEQHTSMNAAAMGASSAARRATSERASTDSPRRHREPRTSSTSSPREDSSSRRRQQQQQQQPQEYVQQPSSNSSRVAAGPTRSHEPPSREASEILNAMVVSPDEVDIEREMTRLALSHTDPSTGMAADADDAADAAAPPPVVPVNSHREYAEESRRGGRSRQEHQTKREKHIKFGEYILGNTIGEGEFGKVKLGWKADRGVQVAIKLIKKDAVGSNPQRMAKIMREVNILRQLNHPNIVQLHKMEESEHHYGIVLEYASGGELFDYILNHRYLNDNAARRLFAQLISGVGYLHKKGIVHRDLKLENLLLDRNRNIIITDFGFANSFDPNEELTEDEELHLADRDWVQRMGFDRPRANGMRKADLMLTSCGSPCYAAPELVVSDSVYTGRKVDVWSCGVILYAMLAGYLPFDDDPKNPEGDNINLLYKYIVSTPLTFPEYVTPHAKDLLRRILVPDPRKRADLFEVARHSWLSEYANLVEFMTSSTTSPSDIQNMTASADDMNENPMLGRSASVRETSKKAITSPAIGGLASKAGTIDLETEAPATKPPRDNKRNTLQVEYVAPSTQTQRGEPPVQAGSSATGGGGGKTRARPSNQGPIAVMAATTASAPAEKPLPREPTGSKDAYGKPQRDSKRPPSAHRTTAGAASALTTVPVYGSGSRPATGGSIMSTNSRMAPPTRASFGQPVPPTLAGTNVHGKIQQPKSSGARNYVISNPIANDATSIGRPSISASQRLAGGAPGYGEGNSSSSHGGHGGDVKGHRRSNTLGDITDKLLGRSGSIFGGKGRKRAEQRQSVMADKASRKYPPLSFSGNAVANMASGSISGDEQPRASMDSAARQSRRSFSLALGKKRSGSIAGSQTSQEKQSKRFSILPSWGKAKGISGSGTESQLDLPIQDPPPPTRGGGGDSATRYSGPGVEGSQEDGMYMHVSDPQQAAIAMSNSSVAMPLQQQEQQQQQQQRQQRQRQSQPPRPTQQHHQRYGSAAEYDRQYLSGYSGNNGNSMNQPSALRDVADNGQRPSRIPAPQMTSEGNQNEDPRRASPSGRVVLQKNKRLEDAYDSDMYSKHDRSGTSGRARRVMDYFRRRSKAKGSET